MRIGYLYDLQAYPPKGGNHRHAYELTQGFVQRGHAVCVVDDPTMPNVTNFDNQLSGIEAFSDNIDVLYVRIDARSTRDWETLSLSMAQAKFKSIPVVWEINSPANESLAYSWLSHKLISAKESIFRRIRRWLHAHRKVPGIWREERYRRQLGKQVTCAICVSKGLGQYASVDLDIKRVMVLPNGGPLISEEEIIKRRAKRTHHELTVFYSGSAIYPWQGLNYISQAAALAEEVAPDIRFVLAVNQRTSNIPVTSNVIILEHLDREQILDAICAADVCVSLHPRYPWSKYGFHNSPMKLFEYMACMAPSLSSNHDQMEDIISNGVDGLLCENTPEDILEKILFIKMNPEQAKSIARYGWERIQSELNWQHNVDETLKCFERAIYERHGD